MIAGIQRESQAAVFYRDGKAMDVFQAGRHHITTANLPVLASLLKLGTGGGNVFTAEVYFVNMIEFTDWKWGTPEPITLRDADFGIRGDGIAAREGIAGYDLAFSTDGGATYPNVIATGLPVWCAGVAAPASVNQLTFVGWNEPIGCGGCAIFPDDIIVADDDGAVVIPAALADFVANEGAEHELMETWLVQQVEQGEKLPGLYPPNEENKKRYEAWKKSR